MYEDWGICLSFLITADQYIYIQCNNIIYILYIVICLPLKYVGMMHKFVERHKKIGIIIKSENSFRQIKLLSSIFALIFNF